MKTWISAALGIGGLALALGVASSLRGRRRSRPLGKIHNDRSNLPPERVAEFEKRIRAAGARGDLTYVGAGMEGFVACDETGRAFKAARSGSLRDEAQWLRMAGQIASIKAHVPKNVSYDADNRVLIRECLKPQPQARGYSERKLWELHQRLTATMAPYGYGRPEFKPDSYVHTRRGSVLVDAGFAVRRGTPLVKDALELLKQNKIPAQDARDMAFALRMERDATVPAKVANKLLAKLKAIEPSVDVD